MGFFDFLVDVLSGTTESELEKYSRAAKTGDLHAYNQIGLLHEFGEGGAAQSFDVAVQWYELAANGGHADAQYNLARMYDNGTGVEQNEVTALVWYRKAAEQGHGTAQMVIENYESKLDRVENMVKQMQENFGSQLSIHKHFAKLGDADAQYELGCLYEDGGEIDDEIVEQDYAQAARWYRKAAEQEHADAQLCLGVLYEHGRGVKQNEETAVKWYRKAAEQGHAIAQNRLGLAYHEGKGVKQDEKKAEKWYLEAAEQGNVDAQYNLAQLYLDGSEDVQDYEEAIRWLHEAAEAEDSDAQHDLAKVYAYGKYVDADEDEALKWYLKAAKADNLNAQCELGWNCMYGLGVELDKKAALKWTRKAAEKGHSEAQYHLGLWYESGMGVVRDVNEAVKWYIKEAGAYSKCKIGFLYATEEELGPDYEKATAYFEEAAEQGNYEAQYVLGIVYRYGLGVETNSVEAEKWFRASLKQGVGDSAYQLAEILYEKNGNEEEFLKLYKIAEQYGVIHKEEAATRLAELNGES